MAPEPPSVAALEKIQEQTLACGVSDLILLDRNQVKEIEPDLRCEVALLSPSTGIVDSHGLMNALLREAEEAGSILLLSTPCLAAEIKSDGFEVEIGSTEPLRAACRTLINSAGIHAREVAGFIGGLDRDFIPSSHLCRCSYFSVNIQLPFKHLIYSVPSDEGPGIHFSLDMAGQGRFGPDTVWMERIDNNLESGRGPFFEHGVRRYWPELPDGSLLPGFTGFFARSYGPNDSIEDWIIQGPEDHGVTGLVNLFGIDSPGLTACFAIAEYVKKSCASRVERK